MSIGADRRMWLMNSLTDKDPMPLSVIRGGLLGWGFLLQVEQAADRDRGAREW